VGLPVGDDGSLFEKLCLEGFQSGLSWLTILRKREAFRHPFAGFDFRKIARFGERHVERMLEGRLDRQAPGEDRIDDRKRAAGDRCWRRVWVDRRLRLALSTPERAGRPYGERPSPEAVALSKDLKKRGWTFVGPTTVYAFMQAMGLVNDHLPGMRDARPARKNAKASERRPRSP
jgi:DNA-3-methyladenine glycosylase I